MDWHALESAMRYDPAHRGLASYRRNGVWLAEGDLKAAAEDLAQSAERVAIVTGFCIADADPPAAETDGPPGAIMLAHCLDALGAEPLLITDSFGAPLLEAGLDCWRLPRAWLHVCPVESQDSRTSDWIDAFFAGPAAGLSHLIAIERPGPSHTLDSLTKQRRHGPPPVETFERLVPLDERNKCHNMRGARIDHVTAPLHLLFEHPSVAATGTRTFGIADGGNEIGCGAIPWEVLCEAIAQGPAACVASRIATERLLLAGISNWGAHALAAAVAMQAKRQIILNEKSLADHAQLIRAMVAAGAVDGTTRRREPTVDGLPVEDYLAQLAEIERIALA